MNRGVGIGCAAWWLLCGLALAVTNAAAQQARSPLRQSHLSVVFSSSLFQSANRNDASAALRVWADTLSRRRGIELQSNIQVVDDAPELRRKLLTGDVSLSVVDVMEYLKLADITDMEPVFYAVRSGGTGQQRYVLLTRADSGITAIGDLRGKNLIVHANTKANLGQLWLDTTLRGGHLDQAIRYFRTVDVVQKGSAAILPVFFGKADAALVDQGTFDTARELNPQLGTKLRVLASSPPLVDTIVCVSRHHQYRQELLDSLRELHLDAEGRQTLLVFRFTRLMPFDKTSLDEVRELCRRADFAAAPAAKAGGTP